MTRYENVSASIVAVYLVLNSAEWLHLFGTRSGRWFGGPVAIGLRFQDRTLNRAISRVVSPTRLHLLANSLALVMLLGGLVLFVEGISGRRAVALEVMLATALPLFNFAFATGLEGSDQMAALVLMVQAVASLESRFRGAAYLFLTSQLILSYVVAGISKSVSPLWRSGEAMVMILSTRSFGTGGGAWLLNHRRASTMLCWLTIGFELSWLFVFGHPNFMLFLMIVTAAFHIANSWLMGLNLFPWAFISAFPIACSTLRTLQSLPLRQWVHV